MKFTRIFLLTVLFVILLLATNYMHMRFMRVNVILYASIADAFIATAIGGAILLFTQYYKIYTAIEKLQLLVIWLLLGYSFAISIPTVIDRSLSFYILEKLQQRGGGIRQTAISDVFTKEYLPEYRLVDVRLTEQLESGTIMIENGCVKLTPKGELLANIGNFYRKNLLPTERLLMGEYTDALTDPFANSIDNVVYKCQ